MTLPPMHRGDAGLVGFIDACYAGEPFCIKATSSFSSIVEREPIVGADVCLGLAEDR